MLFTRRDEWNYRVRICATCPNTPLNPDSTLSTLKMLYTRMYIILTDGVPILISSAMSLLFVLKQLKKAAKLFAI